MSQNTVLFHSMWTRRTTWADSLRVLRALVIMTYLLSLIWVPTINVQSATTITFTAEELLGKPTDTSVAVNIVPAANIEYHYQYGTASGVYTASTSNVTGTGGQPSELVITGLSPNTQYYYRMQYHAPGEAMDDWNNRPEHSFWTQRAPGQPFIFTVTSDSHAQFNTNLQNAMTNILNEDPDFTIDLGDTFMIDNASTQTAVNNAYLALREPDRFDRIGGSVPIFLTPGNHENEEGWNFDDAFNLPLASIQARKLFYPTPIQDGFYSANTDILPSIDAGTYGDQYREDYYAWTWSDALFVVIDEFQYTMDLPYTATAGEGSEAVTGDQWSWTLGQQQFEWLRQTLENSSAPYKFIFSHQMTGGITRAISGVGEGYVRGGAEAAAYFEWGGANADGSDGFATNRDPAEFGTEPIHQLMVANGVSAYFHGHDHQYAYETRDGIVYQEVPSPSMSGSGFSGIYTEGDHGTYNTIQVLPNSGHLRISVTPELATVDYISSASTSGTITYSYTIVPHAPGTTYTLTTGGNPTEGGTVSPAAGAHTYAEGASVPVTATPATGYVFSEWSGACSGTEACTVLMTADQSVTANFTAVPTFNLTTAVTPSGAGTISPAVGTHAYNQGTVVAVTAAPGVGYAFSGWGGACTGTGSCSVTMNADQSVTANFTGSALPITFTGTEFLGRPEDTSISVSVVPDAAISMYYEYGTAPGTYTNVTSTVSATAGQPQVVTITGLTPNTHYYYRMQYSPDGGASWIARPEGSFWTQRVAGSTYSFTITSDSHIDIMLGDSGAWTDTLNDVGADNADFLIDLGDTVAMDNGSTSIGVGDVAAAEQVYKDVLPYFNIISGSSPVFMLPGNHEQQEAWHQLAPEANSLPILGKNAEKKFLLNPLPDSFYNGDTATNPYLNGDQLQQAYYAWEWGDALFVVINPFWFTTTKPYTTTVGGGETDTTGSDNRWDWTLGQEQFNWLQTTLQNSTASYKFVFSHQIVGGNGMSSPINQVNYGHGGVDSANFVEWGGNNTDGTTYTWATNRTGWGSQPIRQMMEANSVTAFFHGHDHQYAYERLNGMVYQAVPSGSFSGSFGTYTTGGNSGNTIWADSTQGPGHLKVTVSSTEATVDFIRSGASSPVYSYTMLPAGSGGTGVTQDGPVYNNTAAANASSASLSVNTGTGNERMMLVGVSWNCGSTGRTISSVTFTPSGGSAVSLEPVITQQAGTQLRYAAIYRLLNPPVGVAGTVNVTFSGEVSNGIVVGAANFSGVDQVAPLGTPGGAGSTSQGTAPTVTLSGLEGDELVFDTLFMGGSDSGQTVTPGASQTQLWSNFSSNTRGASSMEQASGSSVTMSWTASSSAYWAIAAVPLNPSDVTPVCYTLTLSHTGQGSNPTAVPGQSPGCAALGEYEAGQAISLSGATPVAGWQISGWTGTTNDSSTAATNTLTMPSNDHTVTVNYSALPTYTITASAGANGSISPSGSVTVIQGNNQSFTITPSASYHVADVLVDGASVGAVTSYTFTNVTANHAIAATFSADNVSPVAVNDSYSTNINAALIVAAPGVLANDTDANLDPLTAVKVSDPQHGTLILNTNGSFTYTPETSFTGDDTFTYQANDGALNSNTATVTINVSNSLPPVLPSSFYGEIHILADPPTPGQLIYAYVPGVADPVANAAINDATPLNFSMDVPGDSTATPAKDGGVSGDTITFRINGRVVATHAWVGGTNVRLDIHPPEAVAGGPYSGDEGASIGFSGSANDWGSDSSTYQWDWNNDGGYDASGQTPNRTWNDNGSVTVGLKVTDLQGGEGLTSFTVTIQDVLPGNVDAGGPYSGSTGLAVSLSGAATCAAVDTCTFAWDLDNDGAYDDGTGMTLSHVWNAAGDFTIGLRVSDEDGNAVTDTATVHITPGSMEISLVAGWNLVSFNLMPTDPAIATVLNSLAGNYDLVYAWDAQASNWLKYAPNVGYGDTLTELDETSAFWIRMTAADTLVVSGTVPTTTDIPLYTGWNMVGYPSADPLALPGAFSDHGVGTDFSLVYAYHAADSDVWKKYDRTAPIGNDLLELVPGYGYWVQVSANHTWVVGY